jgi:hypothetical protein
VRIVGKNILYAVTLIATLVLVGIVRGGGWRWFALAVAAIALGVVGVAVDRMRKAP